MQLVVENLLNGFKSGVNLFSFAVLGVIAVVVVYILFFEKKDPPAMS